VSVTVAHRWSPIEDYPVSPVSLAKGELRELAAVWAEQREALEDAEGLRDFNQRLRREWSIETGLLERIYTLDRGITMLFIEQGIDSSLIPHDATGQDPEQVAAILRDHEAAIDGLFAFVKGDRQLSVSYINELHAQLTRNQRTVTAMDGLVRRFEVELRRGAFKVQPNNPVRPDGAVHEYCPPEQVASEMDRLLEMHLGHVDVAPEVEAAWLHHRFTQIHPYQDGNGRLARSLATLVLIKSGWFPLVVRDTKEDRQRYIDALEQADGGDLGALVDVVASTQRKAFVQALGISSQVLRLGRAEQVIAATRKKLEERERIRRGEWEKAKQTAARLQDHAIDRFRAVAQRLTEEAGQYLAGSRFFVDAASGQDERSHYFRHQIIETAKRLDYFANFAEHRSWVRLVLRAESQAEILVSFHGSGQEFRGILAASACFFRREETEAGEREVGKIVPLSSEIFQINYREKEQEALVRFRDWLEDVLVRGLETWRAGI
jgi:Fic family protein